MPRTENWWLIKVSSRCLHYFPSAILVQQYGSSILGLINLVETFQQILKLGKMAWFILYNIQFSWLHSLDGFRYVFYCMTVKIIYSFHNKNELFYTERDIGDLQCCACIFLCGVAVKKLPACGVAMISSLMVCDICI